MKLSELSKENAKVGMRFVPDNSTKDAYVLVKKVTSESITLKVKHGYSTSVEEWHYCWDEMPYFSEFWHLVLKIEGFEI